MRKLIVSLFLAGLAATWAAPVSRAGELSGTLTPEEVVRRAAQRMNAIADHTTAAMRQLTTECIRRIEELQSQGRQEEAIALARRCIHQLHEMAAQGIERVMAVAREAHHLLEQMQAGPEYHLAVERAKEMNVGRIRHTLERSVRAIRAALEEGAA